MDPGPNLGLLIGGINILLKHFVNSFWWNFRLDTMKRVSCAMPVVLVNQTLSQLLRFLVGKNLKTWKLKMPPFIVVLPQPPPILQANQSCPTYLCNP